MSQYLALYLASINRTLIVVQWNNVYVLRGILENNPFRFHTDVLVNVDHGIVGDLHNQTMYGFQPVFHIESEQESGTLKMVSAIDVAYCAVSSNAYDTLTYKPVSTASASADDYEMTNATVGLQYYIDTAFTRDVTPDLSVASEYWPETLLNMPPLVEAMPVGTVVQLIGAKGNLAMGEVAAVSQFGHMIVITGIAQWQNTVQDYEIRTPKTTRSLRRRDLLQVERGYVLRNSDGELIKYEQPNYEKSMRYGVAVQPAPGHLFALSQLEIEYRYGKYYPRANTNFDRVDGRWTPTACENLANNFASNIQNGMQQLLNTVGEYTLHLGDRSISVHSGAVLHLECATLGELKPVDEPLVDHNANGF